MATLTEPCELGVAEAAGLLERGELSPVELVESCLARIDAHDGALKAWVLVDRAHSCGLPPRPDPPAPKTVRGLIC